MRDMYNNVTVKRAISPVSVSDNTAQVSQIIDRQGFESLTFAIAWGSLADADATFAVTFEEGNVSNLSDTGAVAAADLLGTLAAAGNTFAGDDTVTKIGVRGNKRYIRMTITPSANTSAAVLSAVAILGRAEYVPAA